MIDIIINIVENYFDLPSGTLQEKRKPTEILEARQTAHYFADKLTRFSHGSIGEKIGGVHRCTVWHSITKVNDRLDCYQEWRNIIKEINSKLEKITKEPNPVNRIFNEAIEISKKDNQKEFLEKIIEKLQHEVSNIIYKKLI